MDMNYYSISNNKNLVYMNFEDFNMKLIEMTEERCKGELKQLEEQIEQLKVSVGQVYCRRFLIKCKEWPHLCSHCWLNDCPIKCYGYFNY